MLIYWRSLLHLFYPELCMGCNSLLIEQEDCLCTSCLYHLPLTHFHLDPNNNTVKQLKGKFPFEFASSMLFLRADSRVEQIIYNLKYNNHPQIGYSLGKLYGLELLQTSWFTQIDYIIPIPLSRSRMMKRGYNQSEYFARGLAEILNIPVEINVLKRKRFQKSQTKMSSIERVQNVERAFYCESLAISEDKNILLLDDVLTTGATIASAAIEIVNTYPKCKIYILTIARAQ